MTMQQDKASQPQPTVILAEDDPEDIALVRKAFQKAGIRCRLQVVENGEELVALLEELEKRPGAAAPKLILLDLNMPLMDGQEALRALQDNRTADGIPIIVLSSSNNKQDLDASYALGARSHYVKPTGFAELIELSQTLKANWLCP